MAQTPCERSEVANYYKVYFGRGHAKLRNRNPALASVAATCLVKRQSSRPDSNRRPAAYKAAALTAELREASRCSICHLSSHTSVGSRGIKRRAYAATLARMGVTSSAASRALPAPRRSARHWSRRPCEGYRRRSIDSGRTRLSDHGGCGRRRLRRGRLSPVAAESRLWRNHP